MQSTLRSCHLAGRRGSRRTSPYELSNWRSPASGLRNQHSLSLAFARLTGLRRPARPAADATRPGTRGLPHPAERGPEMTTRLSRDARGDGRARPFTYAGNRARPVREQDAGGCRSRVDCQEPFLRARRARSTCAAPGATPRPRRAGAARRPSARCCSPASAAPRSPAARRYRPPPVQPNSVLNFGAAPPSARPRPRRCAAGVVAIASNPAGRGYWLVGRRRRRLRFRRRRVLRLDGRHARSTRPIVGIARDPDRARLLARRRRRRRVRLRRRHVPGSTGRRAARTPRSSAIVATRAATATGSSAPTAACSPSATPASRLGASLELTSPIVGAAATTRRPRLLAARRRRRRVRVRRRCASTARGPIARAGGRHCRRPQRPRLLDRARRRQRPRLRRARRAATTPLFDVDARHAKTVAIAASATRRLLARAGRAPTPALDRSPTIRSSRAHRAHESDSAGGYQAVSAGGTYRGAYQFDRSTWNSAAGLAGRPDLVGVDPAAAAPADQDLVAIALFHVTRHAAVGRSLRRSDA